MWIYPKSSNWKPKVGWDKSYLIIHRNYRHDLSKENEDQCDDAHYRHDCCAKNLQAPSYQKLNPFLIFRPLAPKL